GGLVAAQLAINPAAEITKTKWKMSILFMAADDVRAFVRVSATLASSRLAMRSDSRHQPLRVVSYSPQAASDSLPIEVDSPRVAFSLHPTWALRSRLAAAFLRGLCVPPEPPVTIPSSVPRHADVRRRDDALPRARRAAVQNGIPCDARDHPHTRCNRQCREWHCPRQACRPRSRTMCAAISQLHRLQWPPPRPAHKRARSFSPRAPYARRAIARPRDPTPLSRDHKRTRRNDKSAMLTARRRKQESERR